MMRKTALLALVGSAAAFAPAAVPALRSTNAASCMQMQADGVSRRDLMSGLAGAAIVAAPALANADVEYPNVPFLGGSDQVDVNNANIRVYTRFPGMYPTIAGLIVKNGPYKDTADIKAKLGDKLTPAMQSIYAKYEKNFVALKPAPEYVEDIWNNGLYR
jgi:photosystem II PsbU protein